ncbi:ELKS/Rab6-interacting/CAST family member 1 [Nematostella vectensis]|uniref:ELKS/Rab6-interacting/CAST family member 1 n=1 Tax=Nematostella vectensis TaxID=45351 RepID=UPI00138FCAB9|nr:ELKS/Rab6-interacting/CAST family member 1 [Nematostella vectensis]
MSTFGRPKGTRSASPVRSSTAGNLRRSGSFGKSGRSLAASLDATAARNHTRSSTADMGNIENEYIRNLQQQVYFLELEANYLRDQAKKATVIPPRVTEEADRMMRKLRDLQAQLEERGSELSRRESKILMLEAEKDTAIKRMRDSEEEHAAEKRQLVNEIVSLKKLRDMSERDSTRKVLQAQQFKAEAEKGLTSLQDAERRIQNYRAELDRKSEDFNSLRIELEEKRAECLRLKTQLQEMDDRYFDSQAKTKEQLSRELREEIRQLRLQLKEKELNSERDRSLRNKVQDDCTALIKENAALAAQVVELQKHIDMDRAHRDEKDVRRHANIQELISTKENEKQLKTELEKTRELLRLEQSALRDALDKLSREEQASLEANLRRTQLRNELSEVELLQDSTANENVSLNRDKLLLSDEVTSLRARLDEKDDELDSMRLRLEEAEARNAQLEGKVRMQRNLESIKWEEFEKLATTMKAFSRNMSPAKADLDYN